MKNADIVLVSRLSILLLYLFLFLSDSVHSRRYGWHAIRRQTRFLRDCALLSDDALRLIRLSTTYMSVVFGPTRMLTPHIGRILLVKDYSVGLYINRSCWVHVL